MRAVADEHVATLHSQLERMIADGIKQGEFSGKLDAKAAARAFMQATMAFHHPLMLMQNCPTDEEADVAIGIILNGLKAGA
jgi:hypothetical protein